MAHTRLPRWISALAIAGLTAGAISGTALTADAAAPYAISGTVLGKASPSATPAPLEDVTVYLGATVNGSYDPTAVYAYTDAAGHFSFADTADFTLTAGTYDIWYNPCYNPTDAPVVSPCDYEQGETGALTSSNTDNSFTLTSGAPTSVQNITLNKAGFVSGVVLDENGDPAVGEYVFAEPVAGYYGQTYGAKTGEDGIYNLKVRPGQNNVYSSTSKHYDEPNETASCYNQAYQGGATTSSEAVPIPVAVGESISNVDLAYTTSASVRGQVVDASGAGIPWVGSVPYHLNDETGKFDGPRSGPYGTDGTGWWLYCPQPGESYKYSFGDSIQNGIAPDGTTITRTTPYVSGWAGGTSATRLNQAPAYGPLEENDHIDAGKLVLAPFVAGSPLVSLGTPRILSDEGYEEDLFIESRGISPADATWSATQWYRNGVPISSDNNYNRTIDPVAEAGVTYEAELTFTRAGSPSLTVLSAPYVVGGDQGTDEFDTVSYPTISGAAVVGQQLTANAGAFSPAPSAIAYQWFRNGVPVGGATTPTYAVTTADTGAALSVRTRATAAGFEPEALFSALTGAVTDPTLATLSTATPTVSGTKRVGSTLTAVPGAWGPAPVAFGYQWVRNGVAISGAVAATYKPVPSDRNDSISVIVTGTKSGYASSAVSSSASKIAAGKLATKEPKIAGTVKVGKKLTVKPGTWTSGTKFTYRWYRLVGSKWKAISGATKKTYSVKSADRGHKLRVKVTGSKSGYASVVDYSKATAKAK